MKQSLVNIVRSCCLWAVTGLIFPHVVFADEPVSIKYMLRGYFLAASEQMDGLGGGYVGTNRPRPMSDLKDGFPKAQSLQEVTLSVHPDENATFDKKYQGMIVRLMNPTDTKVSFSASDSRLSIVQEAQDKAGRWKPIETLPSSWCGNSDQTLYLQPGEYWEFVAPRYSGPFQTKLRITLRDGNAVLHSEEFEGSIHLEQFSEKQGHSPSDIMDPYFN